MNELLADLLKLLELERIEKNIFRGQSRDIGSKRVFGGQVLGQALTDRSGRAHAMAGLLPHTTTFHQPRLHLGYRRLALCQASPLGQAGTTFRGHEFHYAALDASDPAPPLFDATDARRRPLGQFGAQQGSVAGSFIHLIDRTVEPGDEQFRAHQLRVVEAEPDGS